MHDLTMQAISYALDGLELRARVTADNVANAELPGFRPSRVSFETALSDALAGESLQGVAEPRVVAVAGPFNGTNEVALEDEVVEMIRTGLLREAMVAAYNFKAGQLRTAVRGVAQ
jgi:flagellar basal-body rod protein FlgB